MTDPPYQLFELPGVAAGFRAAADQARRQGRLPLFVRAARWVMEELARTPGEFGESREWHEHARIQARCGFARPLYVEFGVDEANRIVYLRRFVLVR